MALCSRRTIARTSIVAALAAGAAISLTSSASADGASIVGRFDGAASWLRPAMAGGVRVAPPPARRTRARLQSRPTNPGGAPYRIVDLGFPPGLASPIPYAVDDGGDVALQYCSLAACQPTGTIAAYVYVAAQQRLVPLARFVSPQVVSYTPAAMTRSGRLVVGWVTLVQNGAYFDRPVAWTRPTPDTSSIAFLDSGDATTGGRAYAVSYSGNTIVGTSGLGSSDGGRPASFTATSRTLLDTNANHSGDALAVDDAGAAAGDVFGDAAIFANGVGEFIAFPTDPYSYPSAAVSMADDGKSVGYFDGQGPIFGPDAFVVGFLYDPHAGPPSGGARTILLGGGESTSLAAINDADSFVGTVPDTPNAIETGPFINGTFLDDLLPAGSLLPATATALDDANVVVGQAYAGTTLHAFEMVPVTIPPGCPKSPRRPSCL